MHQVDLEEAKTPLPDLVEAAISGIEVVLTIGQS
jgi:antitoxin (DNA-binding transcriptional repressor) of toxin-antitoxin stability system